MPSVSRPCRASLVALALASGPAHAGGLTPEYWEAFAEIGVETRLFAQSPQFSEQRRDDLSVSGQATFLAEWADGDVALRATPFARLDAADFRRTHWDIRELKLDIAEGNWTFTIGADTEFWGKTEAVHLVDIINQTDQIEDLDDEDRLGQPMLRVAYLSDIGEFSAWLMPYFRERSFAGRRGRLRSDPPVNTARPLYETDAEEWTPSFALRYASVIDDVDLGLSAFHGLGRDPVFVFDGTDLRPLYERTTQFGVDVQYTSGATLWKGEGIARLGQKNARLVEEDFIALTGGLEHTLYGIADSNADLGLILEYAWDSRGNDALTAFQDDLIVGIRLGLNDEADTAILLTSAIDTTDASIGVRLEAERRIAQDWTASVEGLAFLNVDPASPGSAFADDSFLQLTLTYYFGTE